MDKRPDIAPSILAECLGWVYSRDGDAWIEEEFMVVKYSPLLWLLQKKRHDVAAELKMWAARGLIMDRVDAAKTRHNTHTKRINGRAVSVVRVTAAGLLMATREGLGNGR